MNLPGFVTLKARRHIVLHEGMETGNDNRTRDDRIEDADALAERVPQGFDGLLFRLYIYRRIAHQEDIKMQQHNNDSNTLEHTKHSIDRTISDRLERGAVCN